MPRTPRIPVGRRIRSRWERRDRVRLQSIGWTLIELLLAIAIGGVLMAIVIPTIGDARESRRVAQAIADIRTIESEISSYVLTTRRPPADLAEIGWDRIVDPWGRPYRYLRFDGLQWVLRARVDRFDVPINSTYDLYSVGRDGASGLALQLPSSWDDVIRANDGVYVGLASEF